MPNMTPPTEYPFRNLQTSLSLLALSVGDAAGENQMKILPAEYYKAGNVAAERGLEDIDWRWPWTDDTHLGIGVVRILFKFNTINQVELAHEFARNFYTDRHRGYGKGTNRLLTTYGYDAISWKEHSQNWWGPNQGSKGNGSAMRDAVIGAHFGNFRRTHNQPYALVVDEAQRSAEVTHYHIDAIAGSIAVAVASANATYSDVADFWVDILANVPAGEVRDRIEFVSSRNAFNESNREVATKVGNGSQVLALDTVPFALWQAHQALARHLTFASCIDSIIEIGGDTDTVAAIFGGIVGNVIPPTQEEIARTEPLPKDLCLT